MKVVNLYGGPGAGKSTAAAFLFAQLKNEGIKTELAREVAKDFIYEGREVQLARNQLLITALQYAKLKDLEHTGCEVAITDSPLGLGIVYSKKEPYYQELWQLVTKLSNEFENINVNITRVKPYQKFARMQNEEEAKKLDHELYLAGYPFALV